MTEIHGLAEAQQVVGSFQWHQLSTLRRLCFHAGANRASCRVEPDLEAVDADPKFGLSLRFDGAQSLVLSELGCPETRITGFYIKDIRERQLDGLHWEIGDFENNDLRFYCDSVSILHVIRLDTGERVRLRDTETT